MTKPTVQFWCLMLRTLSCGIHASPTQPLQALRQSGGFGNQLTIRGRGLGSNETKSTRREGWHGARVCGSCPQKWNIIQLSETPEPYWWTSRCTWTIRSRRCVSQVSFGSEKFGPSELLNWFNLQKWHDSERLWGGSGRLYSGRWRLYWDCRFYRCFLI